MNDTTNEKVLLQVMDLVRGNSAFGNREALVFSLQLLGWAKMSRSEDMKAALRMQDSNYSSPDWVMKTWREIASVSDKHQAAYSDWKVPAHLAPSALGAAIHLCIKLADTGVLEKFDPTDCLPLIGGRNSGEFSLPVEVAELMTFLARIEPSTSVYTPWENSIQLAVRAVRRGATAYLETMQDPLLPALVSLFVEGDLKVAHGDPIREPSAVECGKLRQFDTSLAFPPMGVRYPPEITERDWYGRFRERTNSGTVLATWHLMAQTKGTVVIAVPHSLLFSPGGDRVVREELLRREVIEAVIAMPSGLFSHTNLSFAILVLNMNKRSPSIRFVDADNDRFRLSTSKAKARLKDIEGIVARATGELTDELVAEVPTNAVIDNDMILQVNRFVLPESTQKVDGILSAASTKPLGEIVSIFRPMPTTNSYSDVNAWEVGAADLPEFGFVPPPNKMVWIETATAERNEQQFLRPLDIVIIIKGSVGKVGIVPEDVPEPEVGGWVVGQSGVILRVKNHSIIDPKALLMYLRSPLGRELLDGITVKGATIPLIQQRELLRLPVIIPPKGEAAKIGQLLDEQANLQREIELLRARQINLGKKVWILD